MLKSLILVPALVASALAAPGWGPWGGKQCLTEATVKQLIAGYTYLLQYPQGANFNATANSILSDTAFKVTSDSINQLAGIPLGISAYPNKQAFLAGQAQTPPIPVLQTLGYFYSCDEIAWRWNGTGVGSNMYEVKGIITLDVDVPTSKIGQVYSEFNTGAWLADIGNPECKK